MPDERDDAAPIIELAKSYVWKAEADEDEDIFTAVISTGSVDRDKEVILPKGGDFAGWRANPVIQFVHDYSSPPIAKGLGIKGHRGKIIITAKAAPTERGQEVFELIKGGFLNAVSIGFRPLDDEFGPPTEKELTKNPAWAGARTIYRKWELLEVSVVPVPANAEALITAVSKGLQISEGMAHELEIDLDEATATEIRTPPVVQTPPVIKRPPVVRPQRWDRKIQPGPLSAEEIARIVEDRFKYRVGDPS